MASEPALNDTGAPTGSPETGRPRRLPLGSTRRRLSYERRIRLWLFALALPSFVLTAWLAYRETTSVTVTLGFSVALSALWGIAAAYFFDQLVRPLQTLSNVVAALREDDFSFRARGGRRGDSLGDLALEVNALAGTLQTQRSAARDALTLVERVMTSMQSPMLAFDSSGRLRLLNKAAEHAFHLAPRNALGRPAADLDLTPLLAHQDQDVFIQSGKEASALGFTPMRWSIRRTTFRLQGVPHTLFVLSDVASALREEERIAWQRLIRVLSHEINNSLTPIMSLAGSLRARLPHKTTPPAVDTEDFRRGLSVIEERAASLNRFLQAYQHLTRLPPPHFQIVPFTRLVEQVIDLETRLSIQLSPGPAILLLADSDQLQQLLINLVSNAVEAALSPDRAAPADAQVSISWTASPSQVILLIRDSGPGLSSTANLFVPFYTTKPDGNGIGLVLAQQIATSHHGSVLLYNNSSAPGCTAELRLPLQSAG